MRSIWIPILLLNAACASLASEPPPLAEVEEPLELFAEPDDEAARRALGAGAATVGVDDPVLPPSGAVAFYLVTGTAGGTEGGFGGDGDGVPRPNENPCP